ncbi:sigma 54-interacting transcriptional regulator, partial [bacterium]|nr:sigma 54-interacting transcriptional regulator [bacterium]
TIFLDEIGDLPLGLQIKLLRVLEEGEFERLGNPKTIRVDVRIIATTNRDLEKALEIGRFREDLYYRLNVFPITVPPLRERKDDIPLLVNHFVLRYTKKTGKRIETVSQRVMNALQEYHWPGNIRELENIVERSVITSPGNQLELGGWLSRNDFSFGRSPTSTLQETERQLILTTLKSTGWRVSGDKGAARILGINPRTLESRINRLGIKRPG